MQAKTRPSTLAAPAMLVFVIVLAGCTSTTAALMPIEPIAAAIDEAATPVTMPVPTPTAALKQQVDQWVQTQTQAAHDRYHQTGLPEGQQRVADRIIGLLDGTADWQRPGAPTYAYDPAMLWAVTIQIQADLTATTELKQYAKAIVLSLLAEQAVRDNRYAVARVLMARNLLLDLGEDPSGEHVYQHPKVFMLMGDHAGLCRWYRWHLVQRQNAKDGHPGKPWPIVRINEDLAPKWLQLARMENDPRAMAGWARVAMSPDSNWVGGANLGYVSKDAATFQNRWRLAWQAWAFDAPKTRQRDAQNEYLTAVETGWREQVLFKINANSGRPNRLAEASDAEFERCFTLMRNRYPRWQIRSWGKGPFDAEQARASQKQLEQAWLHWCDSLIDEDPVADVTAYLDVQSRVDAHLKDLNRNDGYREETAERVALSRRYLTFEFEWLLEAERKRRHDEAMATIARASESRRAGLLREHADALAIQAAQLAGDVQAVLRLERTDRHQALALTKDLSIAEHSRLLARSAERTMDTQAFTKSFDRYLQHKEPPRHFSPWSYR